VRGRGLMLGVVLREPVAKQAVAEAPNYGILMNAPQPHVVRLTPPLIISDDQITQAVARFADLLKGVSHDD
jgi:acetylornithine transaminase